MMRILAEMRVLLRLIGLVALLSCGEKNLAADEPQLPTVAVEHGVKWPPIIDSHVHVTYWPIAGRARADGHRRGRRSRGSRILADHEVPDRGVAAGRC